MQKIGIIGGAGVAATNKLNELIEVSLTKNGAYRDFHHPEMIIYQATQAPSRSMYYEEKGESFIPDYIKIGNHLKDAGATILCMCCNTAHKALPILQKQIDLPFINLIEEVVLSARLTGVRRFGLIASDGCLSGKVYESYFNKFFPEAEIIYPTLEFQKEVTRGICNVKNNNRFLPDNHSDRPKVIFENVRRHLKNCGADVIIMGCTDIRVDYENREVLDSLEILANRIYNLQHNEYQD